MVKIPKSIRKRLAAITAKRPKTVISHLLEHAVITTAELTEKYGYEHPPRAIRDVREYGVPIETFKTKDKQGKSIAAYRFGDLSKWRGISGKAAGRTMLTKALKKALLEKFGSRCAIYLEEMEAPLLQVDHRVPYEIGGEVDAADIDGFMLLCPSANRAKSWTCEHCVNWTRKDVTFCLRCFWAHPEDYDHVAGRPMRQIVLTFTGDEIADYEQLVGLYGREKAQDTVKRLINTHLRQGEHSQA